MRARRTLPHALRGSALIVFRVAVTVHEDQLERARVMFGDLSELSRLVDGVVYFDILQDPRQATRFVSIEVYAD
jgi:quinol monooxygenase YgiN